MLGSMDKAFELMDGMTDRVKDLMVKQIERRNKNQKEEISIELVELTEMMLSAEDKEKEFIQNMIDSCRISLEDLNLQIELTDVAKNGGGIKDFLERILVK